MAERIKADPIFNMEWGNPSPCGWFTFTKVTHRKPGGLMFPQGFRVNRHYVPVEGWVKYFEGRGKNKRLEECVKAGTARRSTDPLYELRMYEPVAGV